MMRRRDNNDVKTVELSQNTELWLTYHHETKLLHHHETKLLHITHPNRNKVNNDIMIMP